MDHSFVTTTLPKKINIDGSSDLFYRYKMPQLQIKIHGKNKMVKTEFVNLIDVANALHTDPKYIVAFLGYTTASKFSVNDPIHTYYISGNKQCDELSNKLEEFINSMIICKGCQLPELMLSIDKKLWFTCKGCGLKYNVRFLDKFETFVLKHFTYQKPDIQVSHDMNFIQNDYNIPKDIVWLSDFDDASVQKRKDMLCPESVKKLL